MSHCQQSFFLHDRNSYLGAIYHLFSLKAKEAHSDKFLLLLLYKHIYFISMYIIHIKWNY
jgi:hypothetical protein